VPGSRPLGVLTTGSLQQLVTLYRQRVGRRAVVVGAEHVSFSALLTLEHAGASVAAMVTELPRHQTFAAFRAAAALRWRVPLLARTRVSAVVGRGRVDAVEVTGLDSGRVERIACDTVVFTGDWVPDNELARRGGLAIDPASKGPLVDQHLRGSVPGVFAAGNLVHAAETADVAALGGRHAARAVRDFLDTGAWRAAPEVPLTCEAPLAWVTPGVLAEPAGPPPLGRLVACASGFHRLPVVEAWQGGRRLAGFRLARLVPNRSVRLPAGWLARVDPKGGPVTIRLAG
jgi:hypothetical protein